MKNILASLNNLVTSLEQLGREKEAKVVHKVFVKVAEEWNLHDFNKGMKEGFGNEAVPDQDYLNLNDQELRPPILDRDTTDDPMVSDRELKEFSDRAYACVTSLGRSLHPDITAQLWDDYTQISYLAGNGADAITNDPQASQEFSSALHDWEETLKYVVQSQTVMLSPEEMAKVKDTLSRALSVKAHIFG